MYILNCLMFMFQESKFRSRAIGLRIKETKEVYEGEVTELTPVETESPTAAAGSGSASGGGPVYGKTISHLIIGKEKDQARGLSVSHDWRRALLSELCTMMKNINI